MISKLKYLVYISKLLLLLSIFCPLSKSFANPTVDTDTVAANKMLENPLVLNALQGSIDGEQKQFENGGWGNGHSVRRHGADQPILLDFFTEQPDFQETSFSHKKLEETDQMKYLYFENIKVEDLPAYHHAKKILESWRTNNKGLMDILIVALENLSIQYVWNSVPLADAGTYYLPQYLRNQFPHGVLTPVVVYHTKFGLRISAPEWNALGDLSQCGLLIHEALRRVQLSYNLSVSHEKLQTLTATIVLHRPDENIDLENTKYLDSKLLDEIQEVSSAKIAPNQAQENLCEAKSVSFTKRSSDLIGGTASGQKDFFCESVKNTPLYNTKVYPHIKKLNEEICSKKRDFKLDTTQISVLIWLTLVLQDKDIENKKLQEIQNKNLHTAFSSSELFSEIVSYKMTLPGIISESIDLQSAQTRWSTLNQKFCNKDYQAKSEDFFEAILLLFLTDFPDAEKLQDEAVKAYLSFFTQVERTSRPQIIEKLIEERMREEEYKYSYKDNVWEEIVISHISGKPVKNQEMLKIIQGFRANVENLKRNRPVEYLKFSN